MTEQSANILIAEDEEEVRETLTVALSLDGHTVEAVENGVAAIELLRERDFDLVLMDVVMPEKSGIDVCRWIQKNKPGMEKRVVLVTGWLDVDKARNLIKQTGCEVVGKPFEVDNLCRIVRRRLERTG